MKKLLFISIITITIFLSLSTVASAAPYLICDSQAGVDYYNMDLNGTLINNLLAEVQPDGSLKYDLAGLSVGSYTVKLQACSDLWGCSGWSAIFPFDKTIPGTPSGIRLVIE